MRSEATMNLRAIVLFGMMLALSPYAVGQSPEDDPNDLKSQFEELKDKSNNYQIYKVVKESLLDEFWRSVRDTLRENRDEINDLNKEVAELKAKVTDLQNQVAERDESLAEREYQIEHMEFLGSDWTKGNYITFTWTLIFIFIAGVIILYVRFKSANAVTRRTRRELATLQTEFEEHRKSSREKETKLRRDLQTEINHVEELKGKLGEV